MKCFYHGSDWDGKCSAAIIKNMLPECKMIPIDHYYVDDVYKKYITMISHNETVFMVDFAFDDFSRMIEFNNKCNFIWIDHHASAIKTYDDSDEVIQGKRSNKFAGCELTWMHFNPNREVPPIVRLLGRYDVFDQESKDWHSDIIPFQFGMRYKNPNIIDHKFWNKVLCRNNPSLRTKRIAEDEINGIIKLGEVIYNYEKMVNKRICHSISFPFEFEGVKFLAANRSHIGSLFFDSSYNETEYDAVLAFCNMGTMWKVSMYTSKEEISLDTIATKYGGGGHKQACGFEIDSISKIGI